MKFPSEIIENGIVKKMGQYLLTNYLGKKKAHSRLYLLEYLQIFYPELKDRKMREIYSKYFPIGFKGGEKDKAGIYLIDDPVEIDRMNEIDGKKIDTYQNKIVWREQIKIELIRRKQRKQEQLRLW